MAYVKDPYRELQQHLDKMPVGYPPTKSGVEISLLKTIFTPEEATVTTHLDYKHKTVDQILETVREEVASREQLTRILDGIVAKGGISQRERDGKKQYAVVPLAIWGMYEYQLKRLNPEFLINFGQYIQSEFGYELATSRVPKMRVIPVEESVEAEHHVATYDELRHLIEQAGDDIGIQECMCRKVSDLQGKPCQATDRREVCMSFGDLAELYTEEGWGRRISQKEAFAFARKNEEAVTMADSVSSVDLARCIGCGLCVPTCPENALSLAKKAQEFVPPQTEKDLFDMILAGKRSQLQSQ